MRDFVLGLAFAVLGGAIVFIARDFPSVGGLQFGASLFPTITGVGMLVCGLLLAGKQCRPALQALREQRSGEDRPRFDVVRFLRLALPCVLLVFYIYSSDSIGAAPALCVLMLVLFRAGSVRWSVALPVSIVGALIIYLLFTHLLLVPLPAGLLGF